MIKTISMIFLVALTMMSCAKMDGYYDYQNTEKTFSGSTLAYLESKNGVFDSLLLALDRLPQLRQALDGEELTVFAPTNQSFTLALSNLNLVRSNQGKPQLNLRTLDIVELDTLVSKYIVVGKVSTNEMQYIDGLYVETVIPGLNMHAQRVKEDASGLVDGGLELVYYSDTNDNDFVAQWVRATSQAVNIFSNNGVVHILGGAHEFGYGEFLTRMNK